MDTPTDAVDTALMRALRAEPSERAVLRRAPFAAEPHLTPIARTIPEWLAQHANPNTRVTYTSDIRHYLLWCAAVAILPLNIHPTPQPGDVGPSTFSSYEMHLRAQRDPHGSPLWSARSIQRKISVVSSWYTWCHKTDQAIARNPRDGYRFGSPTPAIPRLTPAHLAALTDAAHRPPRGSATATRGPVLLALLRLGARPQQIRDLRGTHISLSAEAPHVKLPHRQRSDGTTPAPDLVPLDPDAITALLAHYAAVGMPGPDTPVIASRSALPLSGHSLEVFTDSLCRRARIPRVGPDEIRRAFRYHQTHPETP